MLSSMPCFVNVITSEIKLQVFFLANRACSKNVHELAFFSQSARIMFLFDDDLLRQMEAQIKYVMNFYLI